LRDLAGLIVIDFIDMEEKRNNRSVDKRLKDHLKNDRARIQVGRISHFGLMEMSRQRIRASVLESTMKPCPHCGGTGHVRSDSSVALMVVRAIEEFLLKDSRSHIIVRTPSATALYVLNHKRANLVELEARFGLTITIEADETLGTQHYAIFRGAVAEKPEGFVEVRSLPAYVEPEEPEDEIVVEEDEEEVSVQAEQPRQPQHGQHQQRSEDGDGRDRKRRKRRRRRGGRDRDREHTGDVAATPAEVGEADDDVADATEEAAQEATDGGEAVAAAEDAAGKKRRRGKRGGKRNRREDEASEAVAGEAVGDIEDEAAQDVDAVGEPAPAPAAPEQPAAPAAANDDAEAVEKPKKPRRSRAKKAAEETVAETVSEPVAQAQAAPVAVEPEPALAAPAAAEAEPAAHPTRRKPQSIDAPVVPVVSSNVSDEAKTEDKPKRAGWWQRKGFF
ncbi:MAG: ribonuclease E/G, partial [Alphaproteobacteria bacterium]|nr:ribonuclease E/G [Alphaproteobacteria bacterium]